ncbi:MAG TPA: hypothetical protein VKE29_03735 [Candidatus Udaeobacter sp.]|nr:hypothetical protein [Candidatus Udaeobacter sp.]
MNTGAARRSLGKLRANWGQIRTYADLQKQLHRDLLAQHPEWIEANGDCPMCDSYDRRLAELITVFQSATRNSITQAA